MIKWIVIKYLEKELDDIVHNIISLEVNQDVIDGANELHIKYNEQRKNIARVIEYLIN